MNNRSTKRIDLLPQIVQTSCRSGADAVQILCRRVYTPKTIDYQVLCMEKCRVQTFLDFVNVSPKSKDVTQVSVLTWTGRRSNEFHIPRQHLGISSRRNLWILNAKFETHRNLANYDNPVLNVATVDVPGVITSILWRPCKQELYPYGSSACVYLGLCVEAYIISTWALTLSVQQD